MKYIKKYTSHPDIKQQIPCVEQVTCEDFVHICEEEPVMEVALIAGEWTEVVVQIDDGEGGEDGSGRVLKCRRKVAVMRSGGLV